MRSPKTDMNLDSLITEFDRGLRSLTGVVRASRPSPASTTAPSAADATAEYNATGVHHAASTADVSASSDASASAHTSAASDSLDLPPGVLTPDEQRHAAGLM